MNLSVKNNAQSSIMTHLDDNPDSLNGWCLLSVTLLQASKYLHFKAKFFSLLIITEEISYQLTVNSDFNDINGFGKEKEHSKAILIYK